MVAPGGENSDPSEGIVSTWTQGRYAYLAGTSMAVPHVSAAVAMLLAQGLTKDAAVQRVLNTADKVGCGSGCQGFLDVSSAIGVPLAPTPTTAPSGGGAAPTASGTRGRSATARVPATQGAAVVAAPPTTATPAPPSTEATIVDPTTSVPRPRGQQVTLSVRHDGGDNGSHPVTAAVAVALLASVLGATAVAVRRRRGV